jgi:hypothetical protein
VSGIADFEEFDLPVGLLEAVGLFEETEELAETFGRTFLTTFAAVKRAEFATFMRVISPWEREFLLLNVQGQAPRGRRVQIPPSPCTAPDRWRGGRRGGRM